tara:strand:- start:2571 stop:2756 length:186 start_codon:yes stop_codon:yes gene_type:complete
MSEIKKMLTPKDVAGYELVHVNTVLNWIKLGLLPAKKRGYRTYRIRREDYLKFAEKSLDER